MDYQFSDKISSLKASVIREILKFSSLPGFISFSAGNPAPDAFPTELIKKLSNNIMEKDPVLALQYNITEGHTPLRNILKDMMKEKNCFNEDLDELIITSGAQQAVELSCKVLCNERDTVICEAPSFIGSLNSFRSYNVNLVGIELEDDGINIQKLEEALNNNKNTKLIYVIPNFQNPTGLTMSLEKRKAVYALAKKYDVIILEDNPYGDLRWEGESLPSIKSMDTDGRVIYCGSFSKILAPGLRVGYASAPKDIIQKIVVGKQVSDVHSNIWAQLLCTEFLNTVNFEEHLEMLRNIYKHKASLMLSELDKNLGGKVKYTRPQGGLFIWVTLPEGADMMAYCKACVDRKLGVVPGNAFLMKETDPTTAIRINFSTPTDEQIVEGVKIMKEVADSLF